MLLLPHRSVARISSCIFSTVFQSTAQEPNPSIFFFCSLLCHSLLTGCVSPLPRNKQARGQQEWEVGSTFQAAPLLSNHSGSKLVLCTSAQHPGLVMDPREELDGVHSRAFNLISFPLWFQEAKHKGEMATPRAVHSKQGGSAQACFAAPLCRQNAEQMLQPKSTQRAQS